jgi:hypothetical protein
MAKIIVELEKNTLTNIMNTEDGKLFLAWILAEGYLLASDGSGNLESIHRIQGKRKIAENILNEMNNANPDLSKIIINKLLTIKAENSVGKKGK